MQVSVLNVGVGSLEEQIKSFKNPLVLAFQKFLLWRTRGLRAQPMAGDVEGFCFEVKFT